MEKITETANEEGYPAFVSLRRKIPSAKTTPRGKIGGKILESS